jgi:hypothetical protein
MSSNKFVTRSGRRARPVLGLALVLALGLAAVACGGDKGSDTKGAAPKKTTTTEADGAGSTTATTGGAGGATTTTGSSNGVSTTAPIHVGKKFCAAFDDLRKIKLDVTSVSEFKAKYPAYARAWRDMRRAAPIALIGALNVVTGALRSATPLVEAAETPKDLQNLSKRMSLAVSPDILLRVQKAAGTCAKQK